MLSIQAPFVAAMPDDSGRDVDGVRVDPDEVLHGGGLQVSPECRDELESAPRVGTIQD
jgi:hypothetical protein